MNNGIKDQTVTMAHGAGGRQTSELIDNIFAAHFANPDLTADDAAVLNPPVGKMAVSTDGFIVSPAFFPGGNIGKLSICGTVNDLACMGSAHFHDPHRRTIIAFDDLSGCFLFFFHYNKSSMS